MDRKPGVLSLGEATVSAAESGLSRQPFEKSYAVEEEDESVAALVPRYWAAANMKKILGEGGGADDRRGTLVKLGLDYGLMTPFTSFLALESEPAYAAQGIQRKRGPAYGRLAAQDVASEKKKVQNEAVAESDHHMGFGRERAGRPPMPVAAAAPAAPVARELASAPAEEEGTGLGNLGSKDKGSGGGHVDGLIAMDEVRPAMPRKPMGLALRSQKAKAAANRPRGDSSGSVAVPTGTPAARAGANHGSLGI